MDLAALESALAGLGGGVHTCSTAVGAFAVDAAPTASEASLVSAVLRGAGDVVRRWLAGFDAALLVVDATGAPHPAVALALTEAAAAERDTSSSAARRASGGLACGTSVEARTPDGAVDLLTGAHLRGAEAATTFAADGPAQLGLLRRAAGDALERVGAAHGTGGATAHRLPGGGGGGAAHERQPPARVRRVSLSLPGRSRSGSTAGGVGGEPLAPPPPAQQQHHHHPAASRDDTAGQHLHGVLARVTHAASAALPAGGWGVAAPTLTLAWVPLGGLEAALAGAPGSGWGGERLRLGTLLGGRVVAAVACLVASPPPHATAAAGGRLPPAVARLSGVPIRAVRRPVQPLAVPAPPGTPPSAIAAALSWRRVQAGVEAPPPALLAATAPSRAQHPAPEAATCVDVEPAAAATLRLAATRRASLPGAAAFRARPLEAAPWLPQPATPPADAPPPGALRATALTASLLPPVTAEPLLLQRLRQLQATERAAAAAAAALPPAASAPSWGGAAVTPPPPLPWVGGEVGAVDAAGAPPPQPASTAPVAPPSELQALSDAFQAVLARLRPSSPLTAAGGASTPGVVPSGARSRRGSRGTGGAVPGSHPPASAYVIEVPARVDCHRPAAVAAPLGGGGGVGARRFRRNVGGSAGGGGTGGDSATPTPPATTVALPMAAPPLAPCDAAANRLPAFTRLLADPAAAALLQLHAGPPPPPPECDDGAGEACGAVAAVAADGSEGPSRDGAPPQPAQRPLAVTPPPPSPPLAPVEAFADGDLAGGAAPAESGAAAAGPMDITVLPLASGGAGAEDVGGATPASTLDDSLALIVGQPCDPAAGAAVGDVSLGLEGGDGDDGDDDDGEGSVSGRVLVASAVAPFSPGSGLTASAVYARALAAWDGEDDAGTGTGVGTGAGAGTCGEGATQAHAPTADAPPSGGGSVGDPTTQGQPDEAAPNTGGNEGQTPALVLSAPVDDEGSPQPSGRHSADSLEAELPAGACGVTDAQPVADAPLPSAVGGGDGAGADAAGAAEAPAPAHPAAADEPHHSAPSHAADTPEPAPAAAPAQTPPLPADAALPATTDPAVPPASATEAARPRTPRVMVFTAAVARHRASSVTSASPLPASAVALAALTDGLTTVAPATPAAAGGGLSPRGAGGLADLEALAATPLGDLRGEPAHEGGAAAAAAAHPSPPALAAARPGARTGPTRLRLVPSGM